MCMQLRQLEHFEALYRLRSFTNAAHETFVTQSALSRSIRALEAELGHPLFDRTTHAVEPTEAADLLVRHAADVLTAANTLREAAESMSGGEGGRVRVGTGAYPEQPLMTRVMRRLSTAHASLHVAIANGSATDLLAALIRRELDFVVCDISKFAGTPFSDDITMLELATEPLVFVAGCDHPLTATTPTLRNVAKYPWVLPPPAPLGLEVLSESFTGSRNGWTPTYEVGNTIACLEVVKDQRSITLVPLSLALDECGHRGLSFCLARHDQRTNDGIHFLSKRSRSLASQTAVDVVLAEAKSIATASNDWVIANRKGWQTP